MASLERTAVDPRFRCDHGPQACLRRTMQLFEVAGAGPAPVSRSDLSPGGSASGLTLIMQPHLVRRGRIQLATLPPPSSLLSEVPGSSK